MFRRPATLAFALAAAFALGTLVPSRPPAVGADPPPQRKCVGIAAALQTPGTVRVYRAFEDGAVEAFDQGPYTAAAAEKWKPVGK
jgi:hypothetical protein